MSPIIPVTTVNRILRSQLHRTYPDTTFSVRKDDDCVSIAWTDGPLETDVKDRTRWAAGEIYDADFEVSTTLDLTASDVPDKGVAEALVKVGGDSDEGISLGTRFVFTHREHSTDALVGAAASLQAQGFPVRLDERGMPSTDDDARAVVQAADELGFLDSELMRSWHLLAVNVAAGVDLTP